MLRFFRFKGYDRLGTNLQVKNLVQDLFRKWKMSSLIVKEYIMKIQWIETTQVSSEVEKQLTATALAAKAAQSVADTLTLTGQTAQTMDGFGGCFNELGWQALLQLSETDRAQVLDNLFDPVTGSRFNLCRLPIGASDYAVEWYSCNETDGDLNMSHFHIDRDQQYLIPYLKEALKRKPDMKLFASPWSPPTWMKTPKAYNYGRLKEETEILDAYALYFMKFCEAYAAEGIHIDQVHIQNEPFADQKFPSCLWSGSLMKTFIRDHLGPLFEKEGIPTDIWLGTLNGPTPMSFGMGGMQLDLYENTVDEVLFDPEARRYIKGVGFQWAGQHVIQRTHRSFPELKLMQTESECGNGQNSWEYAQYVYSLLCHYLANGTNAYIYWNMVLEPGGRSTWGWNQNAMITVDPENHQVTYHPEYHVMRHFSRFITPGAVRLETSGHWTGACTAFRNPNGEVIVTASNAMDRSRTFVFEGSQRRFEAELSPNSFHTFVIPAE